MLSTNAIRIAVVGAGSIGMRHARVLNAFPEVEVVVIPVRPDRVRQLMGQGVRATGSLEEASSCQGAIIATDTGRHIDDLRRIMEAGIPTILVEKPLAPSC